eukprot:evm.model.NODE_9953_length_5584_cov_18.896311.2
MEQGRGVSVSVVASGQSCLEGLCGGERESGREGVEAGVARAGVADGCDPPQNRNDGAIPALIVA